MRGAKTDMGRSPYSTVAVVDYDNTYEKPAPSDEIERRLVAILAADVEGYSRLMGADEQGTLELLKKCRRVTDSLIDQHHGHFVGSAGDSILVEFASARAAVDCAFEIQQELWVINADLPRNRRMQFRIGVNLGDIIVEGSEIYGHGVNIAARLEGLAEGGGITVSGNVYELVKDQVDFIFDNIGPQYFKNIPEPLPVYRMRMSEDDRPYYGWFRPMTRVAMSSAALGMFALLFVQLAGAWVWLTYFGDGKLDIETAASEPARPDLNDAQIQRLQIAAIPGKLNPGVIFQQCVDCPAMVVLPASEFVMGSPGQEKGRHPTEIEGPRHKVAIAKPFATAQFEITFKEWDACVAAGGCKHNPQDRGWGRGNRPVIYVSWFDAQQYLQWLSDLTGQDYRLLSEAEWEFAARGGTDTRFWWGDKVGVDKAICLGCGERFNGSQTASAGSFAQNPYGLYDVHGNVFEWVQDCWNGSYAGAPTDGSAWLSGDCSMRVLRGGSWGRESQDMRSGRRIKDPPSLRSGKRGFRVAMSLPE